MLKDKLLIFKCFKCNKNRRNTLIKTLYKELQTHKLIDGDICKFRLMLRKGAHPCEYMVTVGRNVMKQNYQQKKNYTLTLTWKIFKI